MIIFFCNGFATQFRPKAAFLLELSIHSSHRHELTGMTSGMRQFLSDLLQ